MKKYAVSGLSFLAGLGMGLGSFPFLAKLKIGPCKMEDEPKVEVDESMSKTSHPLETLGLPRLQNDLIKRKCYSLQYNREKRNAWWAGEYLDSSHSSLPSSHTSSESESESLPVKPNRSKSQFKEDPMIPDQWRSKVKEYKGSGYDRGHLIPAANHSSSQQELNETFYLTNISPQVALGFNRGYWAGLERLVRMAVKEFDGVHVYTGPLWLPQKDPETGYFKVSYRVLGDTIPGTAVPTHFFKVILGVVGSKRYLASFVLPNEPIDIHTPLVDFLVPLESIERASGLEFFPNIRDKNRIEAEFSLCSKVECQVIHEFTKKSKS